MLLGDTVLVDWGAEVNLYCSDCARTMFLAPPDDRWREVYGIVLEAQLEAIGAIRPGAGLKEVDAVARDHIAAAGYGGITSFVVNSHYKGEMIAAHMAKRGDVTLSPEEVLLETGGGVKAVR